MWEEASLKCKTGTTMIARSTTMDVALKLARQEQMRRKMILFFSKTSITSPPLCQAVTRSDTSWHPLRWLQRTLLLWTKRCSRRHWKLTMNGKATWQSSILCMEQLHPIIMGGWPFHFDATGTLTWGKEASWVNTVLYPKLELMLIFSPHNQCGFEKQREEAPWDVPKVFWLKGLMAQKKIYCILHSKEVKTKLKSGYKLLDFLTSDLTI